MDTKTDEQILREIEIYTANAIKLLNRSHEIHKLALDLDNIDAYIVVIKRAAVLQEFSVQEMQKAMDLQHIFSERLTSLQHIRSKFGIF